MKKTMLNMLYKMKFESENTISSLKHKTYVSDSEHELQKDAHYDAGRIVELENIVDFCDKLTDVILNSN